MQVVILYSFCKKVVLAHLYCRASYNPMLADFGVCSIPELQLSHRERKIKHFKACADVALGSFVQPFSFLKWNQLRLVFKASTITIINRSGTTSNFNVAVVSFTSSKEKVPSLGPFRSRN